MKHLIIGGVAGSATSAAESETDEYLKLLFLKRK